MKKSLITDLLSMSNDEIKNYLLINKINKSEFSKNIEDMKLSASINKNRKLFQELSVLKLTVLDVLNEPKDVKMCMEGKLRGVMGKMFVSLIFLIGAAPIIKIICELIAIEI